MNNFFTKQITKIKQENLKEVNKKNDTHKEEIKMIIIDNNLDICDDDTSVEDFKFLKETNLPFYFISNAFEKISDIKGDNSVELKKKIITKLFKIVLLYKEEVLPDLFYFCTLKLDPEFIQNDLGISDDSLAKIVSVLLGSRVTKIRSLVRKLGDLGLVYFQEKKNIRNISTFYKINTNVNEEKKSITFKYIFSVLRDISNTTGNNSFSNKEEIILNCWRDCDKIEGKFFIRFMLRKFNLGAAGKFFQSSLVRAFYELYSKNDESLSDWEKTMEKIFNQFPHNELIIKEFIKTKDPNLVKENCKLKIGVPCRPMLAKPTKEIGIIFKRFENIEFTCEYKYDGLRGQIHFDKSKNITNIFSRNLENMTNQYPDIIRDLKSCLKDNVENIIIDTEIVAFDKKNNSKLTFQTLSKRNRKNIDENNLGCDVCLFCFDILYLNNTNLLNLTLDERREKLKESINFEEGKVSMTDFKNLNEIEDIQEYLNDSIKDGCEGLMIKSLKDNSSYEPCLRTYKWLKLKKDYLNDENNIGDTFDLVPIGAVLGQGSRKNTYGTFLVAIYNVDKDRYEPCTKVGTGLSDEDLQKFYDLYKDRVVKDPPQNFYMINKIKGIDVWFNPLQVWEIKAADLQISPKYSSCNELTKPGELGIGLRFPRFMRVRDDKKIEDSTQPKFIYDLYNSQALIDGELEFKDEMY